MGDHKPGGCYCHFPDFWETLRSCLPTNLMLTNAMWETLEFNAEMVIFLENTLENGLEDVNSLNKSEIKSERP